MSTTFPRVAQFRTPEALRAHGDALGCPLPIDEQILTAEAGSPLATSWRMGPLVVGNRWCIHPMEGWDADEDGAPTERTLRRWERFGRSGAKLIWGGEAAGVVPEGRANPHQTLATESNRAGLARLRETLVAAHRARFGSTAGLVVGLQLTHSGRYCCPTMAGPAPRIAQRHPILDRRGGLDRDSPNVLIGDAELDALVDHFVAAAQRARDVGFDFVDVKACHGYLVHELLGARERPGKYGGDLAGRARFLLTTIDEIRRLVPGLTIGVRLSAFDIVPFEPRPGAEGAVGAPVEHRVPYRWGFGVDENCPTRIDLTEPIKLLQWLAERGVAAVNVTGGSPYYNPHLQRPAIFPPSDGYQPPEDPLVGVWRHLDAARQLKAAVPELPLIGTGYTYLQEFLPHVAQAVVRAGWIDAVGLGRMVLSYPELPADCLERGATERKLFCRTFSDCTTGPRLSLPSGCYPLDAHYKQSPENAELRKRKEARR